MKNYVASNAATGCWWNGKAFSDEGTLAVITAPELAVLKATYDNVIAAEVVSLPTVTEAESWDDAVPTYDDMICENCGCLAGNI